MIHNVTTHYDIHTIQQWYHNSSTTATVVTEDRYKMLHSIIPALAYLSLSLTG